MLVTQSSLEMELTFLSREIAHLPYMAVDTTSGSERRCRRGRRQSAGEGWRTSTSTLVVWHASSFELWTSWVSINCINRLLTGCVNPSMLGLELASSRWFPAPFTFQNRPFQNYIDGCLLDLCSCDIWIGAFFLVFRRIELINRFLSDRTIRNISTIKSRECVLLQESVRPIICSGIFSSSCGNPELGNDLVARLTDLSLKRWICLQSCNLPQFKLGVLLCSVKNLPLLIERQLLHRVLQMDGPFQDDWLDGRRRSLIEIVESGSQFVLWHRRRIGIGMAILLQEYFREYFRMSFLQILVGLLIW